MGNGSGNNYWPSLRDLADRFPDERVHADQLVPILLDGPFVKPNDEPRTFPLFDVEPSRRSPFHLSADDFREAMSRARPDNAPYLDAVAAARRGFADAEKQLGGPVYLAETVTEFDADGYRLRFVYKRKAI